MQIQLYVVTLSNNVDLLTAQSMEIRHPEDIDVLYDILTRSLLDAANRSILRGNSTFLKTLLEQ